jgi:lipoyl-dependent peroxiredoxin
MNKALYTAEARVTGGRQNGRGRTTDGELDVALRLPKELGGEGGGTNPEQLLAVGWAACFEAVMFVVAQRMRIPVEQVSDASIDSKVMLIPGPERTFKLGVELGVELPSVEDPSQAAEVVRMAHANCPYSNATRGNVDVAISVNGVNLESEPART